MTWDASVERDGTRHATPIDGLRPHLHFPGCWCHPTYDEGVWVHHSIDRREEYERGERKLI